MKLIKFIAAAALVASSSLVSGGNIGAVDVAPQIAACTDWPFCREIEVADQTINVARACTDWPFCREIEITEQSMGIQQQMQTEVARKVV
ncbi:MAG: hypothetical protein KKF22_14060 [Gammaproteobacteria bacterium]|nr:hypothetical protein [Gammaproteobacteria bacterium]